VSMPAELVRASAPGRLVTRPFQPGDAAAVARFWQEREFDVPGGVYRVPSIDGNYVLASMRKHHTVWAVVAVQDDRIVGYNEVRRMDARTLHLCYLYLAPEARGTGCGPALMFEAYRYLASLPPDQCRRVVSNFSPANLVIRRLTARGGCPESAPGRLEILLPALLALPPFRRFADRHRLLSSYARYCRAFSPDATGVRRIPADPEDGNDVGGCEWHGARVYPHRFTSGDDWIEVLVDARSLGIRSVSCPRWRAGILPAARAAASAGSPACHIEITNTSPRSLTAAFAGDAQPTWLAPGDTLRLDAAPKPGARGRTLSAHCRIDGEEVTLRAHLPRRMASPATSRRSIAVITAPRETETGAAVVVRHHGVRAELDPSRGGCLRSLQIGDSEFLQFATRPGASLGWIHPWRGGLFYLLHDRPDPFRLDAWGPFPGFCGFNTEPDDCRMTETSVIRVSSRGNLVETTEFRIERHDIQIRTVIENRGRRARASAFGMFAFLARPDSNCLAHARTLEGTVRLGSRRSFELRSARGVTVEMPDRRVALSTQAGSVTCTAFNLGDDGLHVMAASAAAIPGRGETTIAISLSLQNGRV
jgi:GNAT superfamily N-acetyltransferase